jgi:Cu-Zn family superoxide dismutase
MLHPRTRLLGSILGVCSATVLLAGCGGDQPESGNDQPGAPPRNQAHHAKQTSGTFADFQPNAKAITYNPAQVPAGARIDVSSARAEDTSKVTIRVSGLQPNRDYGAHVHTKPCGAKGDDAGPHYQEKADPVRPSVDPAYANPRNEVWLDFHTDAQGNGTATAEGDWTLATREDAKSVVIHETPTHHEPGKAGTAGGRLSCVTADF